MGHVGLLPQSISVLGGFRPQGQSAASALQVIEDALVGLHLPPITCMSWQCKNALGFVACIMSQPQVLTSPKWGGERG